MIRRNRKVWPGLNPLLKSIPLTLYTPLAPTKSGVAALFNKLLEAYTGIRIGRKLESQPV